MTNNYEFESPGKGYKKVKTVKLRLVNEDGVACEQSVGVYLRAAGTPTFCILVPADYWTTWVNHPPKGNLDSSYRIVGSKLDLKNKLISASSFDEATEVLSRMSSHWRDHHANRTMEQCIYVVLELLSSTTNIEPPGFSKSETLVGLTIRWGYRVGGREYQVRNGIDDPLTAIQPQFQDLSPYPGSDAGKVTLPFTPVLWGELLKIKDMLEKAADRLAMLSKTDSAVALLTSLASGTPLLESPESTNEITLLHGAVNGEDAL